MKPWAPASFNALTDNGFIGKPLPVLREAAAASRSVKHEHLLTTWSFFSYADCKEILTNWRQFSSEELTDDRDLMDSSIGRLSENLIGTDPPRHTRLRVLANQGFMPRVINQFAPVAEAVISERMDHLLSNSELDIVESFSAQISVSMISAVLGIPQSDWPLVRRWTMTLADNIQAVLWIDEFEPKRIAATRDTVNEMVDYFHDYLEERRRRPKPGDVISILMEAEVEGERLSQEEIENTAMLFLGAGNETTTNLITNFVRCAAWFPDQFQRIQSNLDLVNSAVEETLRFCPSIRAIMRRVSSDVEFHGIPLKQDDWVLPWMLLANRDPNIFEHPDEFDVGRHPNRHMSFVMGPHTCLGAPLARLETRLTVKALAEKVSSIELVGDPLQAPNGTIDNILRQRVRVLPK